jgi:F-type H+-transporting ATPase subunit gamma
LREIRSHVNSVRSISQVTKALEVVSAAKYHRLQTRVLATRAFADKSWEVLTHLALAASDMASLPIFGGRQVHRIGVLLFTSSRGMVGAHDDNVIAAALRYIEARAIETSFITIGRVGRDALLHQDWPIHADFSLLDDKADITRLAPVAQVVLEGFDEGLYDEVWIAATRLQMSARLQPAMRRLLPIQPPQRGPTRQYIYEPDPDQIVAALVPRIVRFQIYQAFLEAIAAENAARAVAMQTASHNAADLIKHLSVSYSNARQQAITSELRDIVAVSAAQRRERGA